MRFNILLESSSLTDDIKEMLRQLPGDIFEYGSLIMNKWDYVMMHQLVPVLEINPRNQNDINKALDLVMSNERL